MVAISIPWPLSNSPGERPQEGAGKLVNVYPEPRGENAGVVWHRAPGTLVFSRTPSSGSASLTIDANARGAAFLSTFFEYIGSSTYITAVGSTSDVSYPSGTASGDLVFVLRGKDVQQTAWTTPTGFASLAASSTTDFMGYSLMYKISTGETTVSLPGPSAAPEAALLFTIRGADQTTPICDTGSVTTGAAGSPDGIAITATTANSLAITVGWLDNDTIAAPTPPTSFGNTLYANAIPGGTTAGSSGAAIMVAFQPRATTGSVAVSSFGTNATDAWAAYSLTVRHA